MKRRILTVIIVMGSTIAHAQTTAQPNVATTNSVPGSDALDVSTSPLCVSFGCETKLPYSRSGRNSDERNYRSVRSRRYPSDSRS
jgi:hypothetical protein